MMIDYIGIALHLAAAAVCASTFWRAAAMEKDGPSPLLWCLTSLFLFFITWLVLGWRWPWLILTQIAIGVAIGIYRTIIYLRETRS